MAIKGSLKEASLADVCQLLALGFKTGRLAVADGSHFGQIFFKRGRIIFARIVNQRDRLGDLLVRAGLVTREQVEEVLQQQPQQPDRRVGDLLVERRLIEPLELARYVRLQIEEAIYQLFTWSRGNFHFEVDERPDTDILVSINPESLMLEAARRIDEWALIEQKIPSLDLVFEVDVARLETAAVPLTPEQQAVMRLFDGSRSIAQVVDETGLSDFAVGKALFGLVQAGFAHRVGRRGEEPAGSNPTDVQELRNLGVAFFRTGMLSDARREFGRVLELDPQDVHARFHLALIMLHEGKLRDSVRQLRSLLEDCGPNYSAFVNLAIALRALGRVADALLVLDEAESLRPGRARTSLTRGVTLLSARDHGRARHALEEYRQRLGSAQPTAEYYYYAALAAGLSGEPAAAEAMLEEGLALHGACAPLLLLMGSLQEARDDNDAAERYYRRAVEEDGLLPQAFKALADVTYRRGAHEDAQRAYRRVVELAPDFGDDVYAKLGNLHYRRSELQAALAAWARALELNPENSGVRNNLEMAAHAAG